MIRRSLVIEMGGWRPIDTLRQESRGFKLLRGVDFRESKTSGCRTVALPNDSTATERKAAAWEGVMTAGGQAFDKATMPGRFGSRMKAGVPATGSSDPKVVVRGFLRRELRISAALKSTA
jgi:hypothetical protein